MHTGRPTRDASSLCGLLFLLLVATGLLAMHGVQATAGPGDMTGVPMASVSMAHSSHAGRMNETPARRAPGHRHSGGQMCLGVLVLMALLVLATTSFRRVRWSLAVRCPAGPSRDHAGRPPPTPSIHRLCVLRE